LGHWCSRCRGIWYGYLLEVACPVCGKYPQAWRQLLGYAVLFGGIWFALEGDHQTIRWMAFFFRFLLVYVMQTFWKEIDDDEALRNE
jgi:hypothetical protein